MMGQFCFFKESKFVFFVSKRGANSIGEKISKSKLMLK